MTLDPFSDLLRLMSAQSVISGGLIAGGPWAVAIPPSDQIKFWGIVRGSCWLALEGSDTPVAVGEGDVFLLRAPRQHVIASSLDVPPWIWPRFWKIDRVQSRGMARGKNFL